MSPWHRLFVLFSAVFLFPSLITGQKNLSQSTNPSSDPAMAIDSSGRIVVVWTEADWPIPNIGDIFYAVLQNGSWSTGRETFSQLYDAGSPDLCVDTSNLFHLVYSDGKDFFSRDIFYRILKVEDGFWSNIERVFLNALDSSHPRVVVADEGTVYISWEQVVAHADQIKIVMNSKSEGQLWGDNWVDISKNTGTKTAFPAFSEFYGILHACWMDNRNGNWDVYANQGLQDNWGTPEGLGGEQEKQHPALAVDHDGGVHILYGTSSGDVFHSKRVGQTWSLPQLVSSAAYSGGPLDIQSFPNNTLHAVWPETTPSGVSLFYGRADANGNWQQPSKIVEGAVAAGPRIASDPQGQAHVVWMDSGISGQGDIYYMKVPSPETAPLAVMANSAEEGIVPFTIVFDASLSSTSQGQIISYWWDFGDGSKPEKGSQISHIYEKDGTFTARLYVTNSQLIVGSAAAEIFILAGPFPPVGVTVQRVENKALFYREEINSVSWSENPKNNAFLPVDRYFIYRKLDDQEPNHYKKLGEVDADTFLYVDRCFIGSDAIAVYTYAVSAVDSLGREGPKAEALPISSANLRSGLKTKRSNGR